MSDIRKSKGLNIKITRVSRNTDYIWVGDLKRKLKYGNLDIMEIFVIKILVKLV